MHIVGIIPARMESIRFPGKPLAKICGIPMINHVYSRSKVCKKMDEVYIATCDKEIKDYAESIGAKVIMTSNTHKRASDRTAEAMLKIEEVTNLKIDIVVMIQGDEPMVCKEMLESSIKPMLEDKTINVINLMGVLTEEEQNDPNEIKVVVGLDDFALYFSRQPIPSHRGSLLIMYKQVCIIPFRRNFLIKFNKLQTTPLEVAESVDMLRVIEHGYKVKMIFSKFKTYSVDTLLDLRKVERLMKNE